ncbi:OmpA family protein [Shinella sp.]|uniref:OmpA family protein n=1 Tax=Shinella sp. TaxID=1870904 RepID=UPI00301D801D
MTFRSRLFATVALPVLSASLIATPSLADALMKPFEVAQDSSGEGQPSEDELLLLKRQQEEQRQAEEEARRQAEEQQKAADEEAERAAGEQKRQAEEQKAGEKSQRRNKERQRQQPADEQPAEQPAEGEAEQPAQGEAEQPAVTGEQAPAETGTDQQPATAEGAPAETGSEQQPATAEGGEQPAGEQAPVVETLTEEQKQVIAEDPGKTDETVVLPVENGAAVLDSDKDADNSRMSRAERRKQREEQRAQEEVPLPESDDSAQAAISAEVREAAPQKIEAAIKEEGKRVDAAPAFEVPTTTNIINNTVINNTIVNNNTTVNNVDNSTNIDNSNNVTRVNVVEQVDNRTVISIGDQLIVRGDDRPRLRRDSEEVYYDELARGRVRETIVRPGGVRLVTIYNRYGDVIQRTRVDRDGREYILVYAPELEDDARRPDFVDVGYELPPMRLRIPVRDYIIDTSSDPDRDYYDFLAEPPVERVERVYTIDEVKHSARLRDKVRRIDLDTITFATGSAEVPMSQARTLRKVADAMQKILDKDPGETFLIEGHTDAVGSDKSNLVLSDKRAGSVANLLSEVYGIPPENLQTQGYGERFLKVRTEAAEQQNRRVTIRRVTTLVRPIASVN